MFADAHITSLGYLCLCFQARKSLFKQCILIGQISWRTPPATKPPGGLFISSPFEGESLIEAEGLFNLQKAMVSVLHKELEYKVEKRRGAGEGVGSGGGLIENLQ